MWTGASVTMGGYTSPSTTLGRQEWDSRKGGGEKTTAVKAYPAGTCLPRGTMAALLQVLSQTETSSSHSPDCRMSAAVRIAQPQCSSP